MKGIKQGRGARRAIPSPWLLTGPDFLEEYASSFIICTIATESHLPKCLTHIFYSEHQNISVTRYKSHSRPRKTWLGVIHSLPTEINSIRQYYARQHPRYPLPPPQPPSVELPPRKASIYRTSILFGIRPHYRHPIVAPFHRPRPLIVTDRASPLRVRRREFLFPVVRSSVFRIPHHDAPGA